MCFLAGWGTLRFLAFMRCPHLVDGFRVVGDFSSGLAGRFQCDRRAGLTAFERWRGLPAGGLTGAKVLEQLLDPFVLRFLRDRTRNRIGWRPRTRPRADWHSPSCSEANESTAGPDPSNVPSPVLEEHRAIDRGSCRVAEIGEPPYEGSELDMLVRLRLHSLTSSDRGGAENTNPADALTFS